MLVTTRCSFLYHHHAHAHASTVAAAVESVSNVEVKHVKLGTNITRGLVLDEWCVSQTTNTTIASRAQW